MKNIIIYYTKYGTAKKIAEILSKVIGYSKIITAYEFQDIHKSYDNYIIVSPVYNDKMALPIKEFIENNKTWLKEKTIYSLSVNLQGETGKKYLQPIKEILGEKDIIMKSLYGQLILEKLDKVDYNNLKKFYGMVGMTFEDIKKYDVNQVIETALEIKDYIEKRKPKLKDEIINDVVKTFMKKHNTAVLCTGNNNYVRATPIEYNFYKDDLYFISEGGIKFANILINKNVSVGIYDNYENMKSIRGLQISGVAQLVEHKSDEYFEVLSLKNITKNNYEKIPVILNIFKVKIHKIEALNTDFKKYDGDSKQCVVWEDMSKVNKYTVCEYSLLCYSNS